MLPSTQVQVDQSVFLSKSYALPSSGQISTRLIENLSKFGSNYSQLTVLILVLGGLTNLILLLILGSSCAIWIFLMRNEQLLDYIPSFGYLTTDKKKVLLFFINIVVLYTLCGDSIFTYIGVGFMLCFIHAFLFISPSTPKEENPILVQSQYQNFEMEGKK